MRYFALAAALVLAGCNGSPPAPPAETIAAPRSTNRDSRLFSAKPIRQLANFGSCKLYRIDDGTNKVYVAVSGVNNGTCALTVEQDPQ